MVYRYVLSGPTRGVDVHSRYVYDGGDFMRSATTVPAATRLETDIIRVSARETEAGPPYYWEVTRETLDDEVIEAHGAHRVELRPGTGYELQYRIDSGGWTRMAFDADTRETRLEGLRRGTGYLARVRAENVRGWGPWSDEATARTDPDPGVTVSIATPASAKTEGQSLRFTVTASPAPATALRVRVEVSETVDALRERPPTSVTIPAGQSEMSFELETHNDDKDEGHSKVTAKILPGGDYRIGTGTASVTVLDNDPKAEPDPDAVAAEDRGQARNLRTEVIARPGFVEGPGIPRAPSVRLRWHGPSDVPLAQVQWWRVEWAKAANCTGSAPASWNMRKVDANATEHIQAVDTGAAYFRLAPMLEGVGIGKYTAPVCADTASFDRTPPKLPEIRVADARAREGPDAALVFVLTMDQKVGRDIELQYRTESGSATAGVDFRMALDTVVMKRNETTATVEVEVFDDAHDEGRETMTLHVTYDALGRRAQLVDGTATGTIENTDPLPQGWLARFGRTGAAQVTGLLDNRFDEARQAPNRLTLGGRDIRSPLRGARGPGEQGVASGDAVSHWMPGQARHGEGGAGDTLPNRMTDQLRHGEGGATRYDNDPSGVIPTPPPFPQKRESSEQTVAAGDTLSDRTPGQARHGEGGAGDTLSDRMPDQTRAGDQTGTFGQPVTDLQAQEAALNRVPHADSANATLLERTAWHLLNSRGRLYFDQRQFLSQSSFTLSLTGLLNQGTDFKSVPEQVGESESIETATATPDNAGHWSLWGRGALTRFAGEDTGVRLDGDVLTGLLGLDYRRGRWLAGLGLAWHDGDGD